MRKIYLFISVLLPVLVLGQSTDQNFVKTMVYREPGAGNPSSSVTYFDGLGRPIQQIAGGQSGVGKDIVTHVEYDAYGRQQKEYLPWASGQTGLQYVDNVTVLLSDLNNQYVSLYGDINPFSEKAFEASPLNRVLKQAAPGDAWKMGGGHEMRFDYQTNDDSEVRLFGVNPTTFSIIDNNDYYNREQLFKTITMDENWNGGLNHTTEEFKDKEGRVVLKRTYANTPGNTEERHDTYYVYDDYGNLTYVLPPLVNYNTTIDQGVLDGLCYQYKYDHRNRLVEKKLPGKQWEYIVYNSQNMAVATGPALDPFDGSQEGWLVTKYDAFGRVVYTGWKQGSVDSQSRVQFQNQLTGTWAEHFDAQGSSIDGVTVSYSNNVYPNTLALLTVNFYDRYDYAGLPQTLPGQVFGASVATAVKGLATGSWVRVVQDANSHNAEITFLLYDEKGRQLLSHKDNHLGGFTTVENELDFMGKVGQTLTTHKATSAATALQVVDKFTYTPEDRLESHVHQIGSMDAQLLAANTYDPLGQLITKQVGGTDTSTFVGLQEVNYGYNIRGWLTNINNVLGLTVNGAPQDLFAFKINYNAVEDDVNQQVRPLYNGNIAEAFWRSSTDDVQRKYGYAYDSLNRLNNAIYQKPNNAVPVTNMYNELIDYDKNGNMTHLRRNGDLDSDQTAVSTFEIDNLSYVYDSHNPNQLEKVTDYSYITLGFRDDTAADPNDVSKDYEYDANGNIIKDENKRIERIYYNHLNLPLLIHFADGNEITYLYNALGQKVEKTVVQSTTSTNTWYLDGFQYTDTILNFFPHAEGYVRAVLCEPACQGSDYSFNYVFNYTDHLGNIRLSYAYDRAAGGLKVLEENHYYPFGLKHTNYNTQKRDFKQDDEELPIFAKIVQVPAGGNVPYKYKFQGQERQDELGLNWDSFRFRNYDYAIGRFMTIDPLAEKYPGWSPYTFSGNRVIDARELEGLEPYVLFNSKDEAANNFSKLYNSRSIVDNREFVTKIYETTDMYGCIVYAYAEPERGTPAGANPSSVNIPSGTTYVAVAHLHGAYDARYANDVFSGIVGDPTSDGDMGYAERHNVDIYVGTPNGSFQKYDFVTNTITLLGTDLPSDPLHPSRLNTRNPVVPAVITPLPVVPITPTPITPTPITPTPITPTPIIPAPITPAPITPAPITPAPKPVILPNPIKT